MKQREHLGYFEEFMLVREGQSPKGLGCRRFAVELPPEQAGRTLGAYGRRDFALTESLTLKAGHREVVVKATPTKPLRVFTMLQRLEGREVE